MTNGTRLVKMIRRAHMIGWLGSIIQMTCTLAPKIPNVVHLKRYVYSFASIFLAYTTSILKVLS